MTCDNRQRLYFCPGESHPVSFSVHVARLNAAYPKCRECPLNQHTGHLRIETLETATETPTRTPRPSLVSAQGVRGVYLNELTRLTAGRYAAAFAEYQSTRTQHDSDSIQMAIGYQEHSAAPDLMVGVVNALRRSGVQMVEIGHTTSPALSFAIRELQVDAGILITNSGASAAEIGLDFLQPGGIPLRDPRALREIECRAQEEHEWRCGRLGGYRTFLSQTGYAAGLTRWYHALRPLRLVLATPLRLVREYAQQLFAQLPCHLELLPLAERRRELDRPLDIDLTKLSHAIIQSHADFGCLIDDDGRRMAVVDERGILVATSEWGRLISERSQPGTVTRVTRVTPEGEVWFAGEPPLADGLLTLAQLLQALSRSDEVLSERIAGLSAREISFAA